MPCDTGLHYFRKGVKSVKLLETTMSDLSSLIHTQYSQYLIQDGNDSSEYIYPQTCAMSRETLSLGFPTRSDINQTEQLQTIVRGLNFWI